MKLVEKFKVWAKTAGIAGLLYVPIAIAAWSVMGWPYIAFGALSIFGYINFNIVWKLITDTYKKL